MKQKIKIPQEEWRNGEIYYCSMGDDDNTYIFLHETGRVTASSICIECEEYTEDCEFWNNGEYDEELRIATEEEKMWLRACIKAKKFILLQDVIKHSEYQIY